MINFLQRMQMKSRENGALTSWHKHAETSATVVSDGHENLVMTQRVRIGVRVAHGSDFG